MTRGGTGSIYTSKSLILIFHGCVHSEITQRNMDFCAMDDENKCATQPPIDIKKACL